MKHTPEAIQEAVKQIKDYSDEDLVFMFKVISSKQSKKEKELYKPLLLAIEKERKKRGATTVSTKVDGIKTSNIEQEN